MKILITELLLEDVVMGLPTERDAPTCVITKSLSAYPPLAILQKLLKMIL